MLNPMSKIPDSILHKLLDGQQCVSRSIPLNNDGTVSLFGDTFSPNLDEQSMVPFESEKGPFVVLFVNINADEKGSWPDCVWIGDIDLSKYEGI